MADATDSYDRQLRVPQTAVTIAIGVRIDFTSAAIGTRLGTGSDDVDAGAGTLMYVVAAFTWM